MTPDPTPDPPAAARPDLLATPRRLKRRADLAGDLLALVVTFVAAAGALTLLAIGVVTS